MSEIMAGSPLEIDGISMNACFGKALPGGLRTVHPDYEEHVTAAYMNGEFIHFLDGTVAVEFLEERSMGGTLTILEAIVVNIDAPIRAYPDTRPAVFAPVQVMPLTLTTSSIAAGLQGLVRIVPPGKLIKEDERFFIVDSMTHEVYELIGVGTVLPTSMLAFFRAYVFPHTVAINSELYMVAPEALTIDE